MSRTGCHNRSSQVTFIYIMLLTIKIVTKQIHNIKIGKWCVNNVLLTRFNTQFPVQYSLLNFVMHHPSQFSLNRICAIKSMISLEMKCPQLSKSEATAARKQNSIGDATEWRKNLVRNQAQSGGQFPSGQTNQQFVPTEAKSDCKGSTGSSGLFPMAV